MSGPVAIDLPSYRTRPVEYRAWSCMRTRCTNPRCRDWPRYGGRGITVCDRWRSFAAFFADVGPKPSHAHSLDRIDSDGDYAPGNVRWATAKEQANNWATRNRRISFQGETHGLGVWASRLGIRRESLRDRLDSGWPIERALTTPAIRFRRRLSDGTFKTSRD